MPEKQPDLSGMSYAALAAVAAEAADEAANIKRWQGAIAAEIGKRLDASVKAAMQQADKQSGTVTLPLQDGIIAKADVSKTVKWDSEKLLSIAQTMPWERARGLFKFVLAVPENTYKALRDLDPALADRVDEARTVEYGEPKIKLEKEEVK